MSHVRRWATAAGALIGLLAAVPALGAGAADPPTAGTNVSTCNNPVLNKSLAEWGTVRGPAPVRQAVTDHASARFAFVQRASTVSNPSFYLPQQPVRAGERWTFGYDTQAGQPGRARAEVDWYATPEGDNSGYLGHVNGAWVTVPGGAGWTRIADEFTVPTGAVRANVLTGHEYAGTGVTVLATACDYRTGQPAAPTTPPPTTPPGTPDTPTTAAARYGWGTPQPDSDEFDVSGPADPQRWQLPTGSEGGTPGCQTGPGGSGRACAKNVSVAGGVLSISGEDNGDSGWIRHRTERRYGRWEVRSRSRNVGAAGGPYQVGHLIRPSSGADGGYDFVSSANPEASCLGAFLHYPNSRADDTVYRERCPVDVTEWHNYGFEWTAAGLVGYLDGAEWFRVAGGAGTGGRSDIQAMAAGGYAAQLDTVTGNDGLRPAVLDIDWVRAYA